MRRKLLLFIGGSDNGDHSRLLKLAERGGTSNWSSVKTAQRGDRVLIYIQRPISALVAKATVLDEPVRGKPGDYAYRSRIGHFELLPKQVTIDELRREFPKWGWPR